MIKHIIIVVIRMKAIEIKSSKRNSLIGDSSSLVIGRCIMTVYKC